MVTEAQAAGEALSWRRGLDSTLTPDRRNGRRRKEDAPRTRNGRGENPPRSHVPRGASGAHPACNRLSQTRRLFNKYSRQPGVPLRRPAKAAYTFLDLQSLEFKAPSAGLGNIQTFPTGARDVTSGRATDREHKSRQQKEVQKPTLAGKRIATSSV